MIKLVIVDDDKKTREGLKKCIPWKSLGVDAVEEAEDGVAALDLISDTLPDIILCDIMMPKMNGIELATQVRKKLPECKIIFISGYSDKKYLKSAIQLKAVSYVEKPINIKELKDTIQNAVSIIMDERKLKKNENEKTSRIAKSAPIIAQHISLYLSNKNLNINEIQDELILAGLDLPLNGQYLTILFKLNCMKDSLYETQQQNIYQVLKSIDEAYAGESLTSILGLKDNFYIISHILVNNSISDLLIEKALKKIRTNICSTLNNMFIGVGKRVNGIENISHSYQQAVIAIQKNFFSSSRGIVFYEDTSDSYVLNETLEGKFTECLQTENKDQAVVLIEKLSEEILKHNNTVVDYVKNIFYNLLLQLSRCANERGIEIFDACIKNDTQLHIIYNLYTLHEIKDYLIDKINQFFRCMDERNDKSKTVYEIMKYIQKNYMNSDLSIKSISEHLHLTHTYLCMLFKKETGKTINKYVTETRIEKSKKFLKSGNATLYEIAVNIGYSNPKYFAAIFKKITGFTPSEFRERY